MPWGFAAVFTCLILTAVQGSSALGQDRPSNNKEICKRNLRLIYDAIQAYRMANKDLPHSLSELFPRYLADPNILFCPEARKRALTSIAATRRGGFSDPRTSYFYEFSDTPLQEVPGRTNRDWKRAQMGLLGGVVPIVRCLVHDHPLNLSFGGEIYESDNLEWEYKFTNVVDFAHLSPEYLLTPARAVRVIEIPPRDPAATPDQVNLSDFYNGSLTKPWIPGEPTHNLATLPRGLQELEGIRFDLRGVIQLSSPGLRKLDEGFPKRVEIPLNRSCRKLHFLFGSSLTGQAGAVAGSLEIQFADGQTEQVPLRMGTELSTAWPALKTTARPASATLAWQAQPPNRGQLFTLSWTNPRPAAQVRSVACIGGTATPDFFLVALSVAP